MLASLWWIVPLVVHAGYGVDFLQFTEQPRTIWAHQQRPGGAAPDGVLDLLRRRRASAAPTGPSSPRPARCCSTRCVVGASLLLPALAVAGFVWTRRLPLRAVPPAAPARRRGDRGGRLPGRDAGREAMEWIYRNVPLVRFMRTTQKAAPLVAIGVAGLLGLAAQVAWARLRALRPAPARAPRWWRAARPGGADRAWPRCRSCAARRSRSSSPGTASPRRGREAGARPRPRAAAQHARDRAARPDLRLLQLGRHDRRDPARASPTARSRCATRRPTRTRTPPTCSGTVDRLVAAAPPAARAAACRCCELMGVRRRGHRQRRRHPAAAARSTPPRPPPTLAGQGLGRPVAQLRPRARAAARRGRPRPARDRCPQVRRYDLPRGAASCSVMPTGPATIVDGGAEGLAGAGRLRRAARRAARSSTPGDLTTGELRRDAAQGADVVVTDSNRRRRFMPEYAQPEPRPRRCARPSR